MNARDLIENASRGAALLLGNPLRPTYAGLARVLRVERSQVTRWAAGETRASPRHVEMLIELAAFADDSASLKEKVEKRMENYIEQEGEPMVMVRLHQLDGWSFAELEGANPLGAAEIWQVVRKRRQRRQCDLCGAPMPRAAYPADDIPDRPHARRLRHVAHYSAQDGPAIGTTVCSRCFHEVDESRS